MKKILFILLMSFCLIGCQTEKTEFKNVNNICELTNIIENNDEVIVEISKNTCPYCNELNEKKSELQQDVVIYKYEINEETTDTDMEYLKNNFDPFKYVPTFYYIKKNKVIDYLVISDWNNPIKELDNWIQNVKRVELPLFLFINISSMTNFKNADSYYIFFN